MLALLAQLAPLPGETRANAQRAAALLRANAACDIAVFPELYLGAYDLSLVAASARPADSAELRLVAEAAAEASTAVVLGFAETTPDGTLANSVACIDRDGSLAGVYRKVQLFDRERDVFEPGSELRIFALGGRAVAPLVCFDVEFPELARQLAQAGADLLVTASANMAPYFADHELATRARALDNRLPHLYANAVGSVRGVRFVGGSRSIGADGAVLAAAGADAEEPLVAPVGAAEAADERVDYLRRVPGRLPVTTEERLPLRG